MRLTLREIETIRRVTRKVFGEDAIVRLFGSRVDDKRRGGDIDLHVDASPAVADLKHELQFHLELIKALGERKIDIVIHGRDTPVRPIDEVAEKRGCVL